MAKNLARVFFFILLCPFIANAQLESRFLFNGQNAEVLSAEKNIVVVTPKVVDVPSTCSRQVFDRYEEVCRNETRYDRQCRWIPPSQNCYNEPYRSCRPVTRTRQECSTGPSRQVCTDVPSRQVCTDRPSRRVCTTRPDGRQVCSDVGGGRSCTQVGGGRSCNTVPGERTCRMVTYTDQECSTQYRNRCDTIPGRDECHDVPYSVPVCEDVARYRTEYYSCIKQETIEEKFPKVLRNTVQVEINTNGLVEEVPFLVSVKESSREFKNFSVDVKLEKEPELIVFMKNKSVKKVSETEKEIVLETRVSLEVVARDMLPIEFPVKVLSAEIKGKKLTLTFDGSASAFGSFGVLITHKAFLSSTKTIVDLQGDFPSEVAQVGEVGNKLALQVDLTNGVKREFKAKNMKLRLKLSSEANVSGEILNSKKPEFSKSYQDVPVVLK